MIRPGIGNHLCERKYTRAQRFDGTFTDPRQANLFKETIGMSDEIFENVILTEWGLPRTQDIILGKPWLSQFNPCIDWNTHNVTINSPIMEVNINAFEEKLFNNDCEKLYVVC